MKQHEAVIKVMEANGGWATLGYLYQEAPKVPDVIWGTKTPYKSINRIVQTHEEFFKIRPGLWALKAYKNQLPSEIFVNTDDQRGKPQVIEFNHTYYQGLLVEIGNLSQMITYIPKQDSKKLFVDKPLSHLARLGKIYPFGYDELVRKAGMVDVVWFNRREMPTAMFEVEHSTDIQNSLLKFNELQDFHIRFHIVADTKRKPEFERKIAYDAFVNIQSRVKFWNYDDVSALHTKMAELSVIENRMQ